MPGNGQVRFGGRLPGKGPDQLRRLAASAYPAPDCLKPSLLADIRKSRSTDTSNDPLHRSRSVTKIEADASSVSMTATRRREPRGTPPPPLLRLWVCAPWTAAGEPR